MWVTTPSQSCRAGCPCPSSHSAGPSQFPTVDSPPSLWLPSMSLYLGQALCEVLDTSYLAQCSSQAYGQGLSSPLCKEPEALGGEVVSQVHSQNMAQTPRPLPSAQPALEVEA